MTHVGLASDRVREIQEAALTEKASPVAHWGPDPSRYSSSTGHSNRLIPVYTYGTAGGGDGIDLQSYTGQNSTYRCEEKLTRLYGGRSQGTQHKDADYMDQTEIHALQLAALKAGKKHIILIVFDGMDWDTTRAAAIWNSQRVSYSSGRGTGTHFQEYLADGTSQFGYMVTSPFATDAEVDVDSQTIEGPVGGLAGGYAAELGGAAPWIKPTVAEYLVGGPDRADTRHAVTDSAASATSMTSGIKTYNAAINVDPHGRQSLTIAHRAQEAGYRVGAVTSVPISHATPAATYGHNVNRADYQDLSRDLLGLPSISHPDQPLPGMDVVIGCGHGVATEKDKAQGKNFVPGNTYLTSADLKAVDAAQGGKYVVAVRSPQADGGQVLADAARRAVADNKRLLGFFGVARGHLPFASADGDYAPAPGIDGKRIDYTADDIRENPTLAEMTQAALTVLGQSDAGFWLLIESGDVDWANHNNNLDASIGAVISGDAAVKVVTSWVEEHSNWQESLVIITGDHGHYLVLDRPELLIVDEGEGHIDPSEAGN